MKKEKSKHNTFSNIAYAVGNIWRWDKVLLLFMLPGIPLAIVMPIASNYFTKILIDSVGAQRSIRELILIICAWFGIMVAADIFNNLRASKLHMRNYSITLRYQHALTEKYMRTDYINVDNPDAINKYELAMGDACSGQCAPEFIMNSLISLLISLLGLFTYGSIITLVSPWILALLFLSAFVNYMIGRLQTRYIEKNKDKWINIDRKIGYLQGFSEKFDYAKDIRLCGMFGWLGDMLASFHKDRFEWTKKLSARSLIGGFLNALLTLARDGAAYGFLIAMVLSDRIGAGDFVFYFGMISGFSAWLNGIGGMMNDIAYKSVRIGYYREYFEIDEKYNHGNGCPLPASEELPVCVEFDNVSFRYPSSDENNFVLKNINLTLQRGEKLAIVGENGAGKTTLIKLLCGLYYPSEGEVRLNGHTVSEYNIEDYYTMFSAVFQDIYLLPVTIAEFVSSSEEHIDRDRVMQVLRQADLADKIASLPGGIDSKLMKGVFDDSIELSGGEKQKLMLARALYKDAPVIVLDEPTAALDPIAENKLYLKYRELTENKTSVYISHRLASTRFCDRIIYLENGEIAECGTHYELISLGEKYAHMFEVQSHYYREETENA